MTTEVAHFNKSRYIQHRENSRTNKRIRINLDSDGSRVSPGVVAGLRGNFPKAETGFFFSGFVGRRNEKYRFKTVRNPFNKVSASTAERKKGPAKKKHKSNARGEDSGGFDVTGNARNQTGKNPKQTEPPLDQSLAVVSSFSLTSPVRDVKTGREKSN
ncbi:hypothetical protein GWI33_023396 [Rhynchophorus ferrugineus]|uniref:Uncharacterized protein n=1 Tax=Rhynchophorus ferrugineus TaxID=354439 RepID=A0A834IPJ6_RHYFE|nr:hypothetical protein GWI33_023396 [Rhynchophorus ferrugineus]